MSRQLPEIDQGYDGFQQRYGGDDLGNSLIPPTEWLSRRDFNNLMFGLGLSLLAIRCLPRPDPVGLPTIGVTTFPPSPPGVTLSPPASPPAPPASPDTKNGEQATLASLNGIDGVFPEMGGSSEKLTPIRWQEDAAARKYLQENSLVPIVGTDGVLAWSRKTNGYSYYVAPAPENLAGLNITQIQEGAVRYGGDEFLFVNQFGSGDFITMVVAPDGKLQALYRFGDLILPIGGHVVKVAPNSEVIIDGQKLTVTVDDRNFYAATAEMPTFTADEVMKESDENLIAIAQQVVPKAIEGRVDFAGMELEVSEVYRGGVGKEYQYDFVLLTDKETGMISAVYQLETGKVLHVFGERYEKDGKIGPLVLVVTDDTVLEQDIYLGLNDKIGPKDDPTKQITNKGQILDAAVETVVHKRAFVWFWKNRLSDSNGLWTDPNGFYVVGMNQKGYDKVIVADMNQIELDSFVVETMEDYLTNSGDRAIVIVASTDPSLQWNQLGFSGERSSRDDHSEGRIAYMWRMPSWKDGEGSLPLYYKGMPPGGQSMVGITLIGGADSIGGVGAAPGEPRALWETQVLSRFCGGVPGKEESLNWRAYQYYDCVVKTQAFGK